MHAPKPRLRGNKDVLYILLVVAIVGVITGFLLDHLHTRHLLFSVAKERSMTAYEVRKLQEEARHLRLEERIREASVVRDEAPATYAPTPASRTVRAHLPKEAPPAPVDAQADDIEREDANHDEVEP